MAPLRPAPSPHTTGMAAGRLDSLRRASARQAAEVLVGGVAGLLLLHAVADLPGGGGGQLVLRAVADLAGGGGGL